MKVLIVCSKNSGSIAPFITEQVEALNGLGVETEYFGVEQKGWRGYLKSRKPLKRKIMEFKPDIIHAHFGLSGLLANLQRKIPVITTYHGSDINVEQVFRFSKWSIRLSKFNIFVSQKNLEKVNAKSNVAHIPCGTDVDVFKPLNKTEINEKLRLQAEVKNILFAGAFENKVKNAELAQKAVALLNNAHLIELKGFTRDEVAQLMNAVDACLMTSFTEGSPQFIKEAMACNCPIVSVDVGDVKDVIEGVKNCYIADYDEKDITGKLQLILDKGGCSNGRDKILKMGLDSESVARKLISVYNGVLEKNND